MDSNDLQTVAQFLIADFENEMQTTLRVFEAVPRSNLNYSPDPKSRTALGLLRHITLEDEWILSAVADGKFVPPPDDSDACGIMDPAGAISRYKEKIPAALNRVRSIPPEKLSTVVDPLGTVQMPAISFLALALKHSSSSPRPTQYVSAADGRQSSWNLWAFR